jgi:nicotinamide-nucleotide amidase
MIKKSKSTAIISLGTELTRGDVQDSHLVFLGKELRRIGLDVGKVSILPDDREDASREIAALVSEYPLVIVTGGLGPTSDDITREAISDATGLDLLFREDVWETIESRFWGRPVSESNRKQAMLPAGFTAIDNPRGTACGFTGIINETTLVVLPGPPHELEPMFADSVIPMLVKSAVASAFNTIEGCVFLVGESLIEDEYRNADRPDVSFHTRLGKDRVLFRLVGGSEESRECVFAHFSRAFGVTLVRRGNASAAELLTNALLEKGKVVVTAESCTGGIIAESITDIAGSSNVFWGGFVVYANNAKTGMLGIEQSLIETKGTVSEDTVLGMASAALTRSGVGFPYPASQDQQVELRINRSVLSGSRSRVRAGSP